MIVVSVMTEAIEMHFRRMCPGTLIVAQGTPIGHEIPLGVVFAAGTINFDHEDWWDELKMRSMDRRIHLL